MPLDSTTLIVGALAILAVALVIWQRRRGVTVVSAAPERAERQDAPLPADPDAAVAELVARGNKIGAIKLVRERTGWGLKEAKDYVDALPDGPPLAQIGAPVVEAPPPLAQSELDQAARNMVARGNKIGAIKLVREQTGLGLKEAKDYVDALERA